MIVEPSSYEIVAVLPCSRRSTAAAPARTERRKATFRERDREVIRKHAKVRPFEIADASRPEKNLLIDMSD